MRTDQLKALVERRGKPESYKKGQVFHSLDFDDKVYMIKSGYVKRSAVNERSRVIESIYGPGYFFPLTPVFNKLSDLNLGQDDNTYIYNAMTDVEIKSLKLEELEEAIEANTDLYAGLLYEAGRRLKANINRLAGNALGDDYRKVAHQLVCLADEFGKLEQKGPKQGIKIAVPLQATDMAEQLNISPEVVKAIMSDLEARKLLNIKRKLLHIPDVDLLRDTYLT